MQRDKALVIFSGGQDSTTCLYWAKKYYKEVWALTFIYGQKHIVEVEHAQKIALSAGVHWDKMDVSFIGQLSSNALTDTSVVMDKDKPAENTNE